MSQLQQLKRTDRGRLQPRKEAHQARNDGSMLDRTVVYCLCFRMVPRALHGLHRDLKQKKEESVKITLVLNE